MHVPSCFVVPAPKKPGPPPFPGTVTPEQLRPDPDPPRAFLLPWKAFAETPRLGEGSRLLPVMVDAALLAAADERWDTEATLACVFKGHPDAAKLAEAVRISMRNPFASNESPIVWTLDRRVRPNPSAATKLGGKKLATRHRILQGAPWSIACLGEDGVGPRRNMIYGPDGDAIAQVDFGHGAGLGIHVHALVRGNLEHTPSESEDHLFHLRGVPWAWTVVPEVGGAEGGALQSRSPPPLLGSAAAAAAGAAAGVTAAAKGGDRSNDNDNDVDDDGEAAMLARAAPLPDTRAADGIDGWCRVSLPFEDFMGSNSSSFS